MKSGTTPQLDGRRVLVVGLARSGVAAAGFAVSRGAAVTINDIRDQEALSEEISKLDPRVQLELGGHPAALFLNSELIVVSPGVPADLEPLDRARAAGIPVWAEVELAARYLEGPIIGVTGSNGKTTTTTLIGELFRAANLPCEVAGNIGRPLIEVAASGPDADTTCVVELSSFQLETIDSFRPDIALLLNISPDHLDRHKSLQAYRLAKERVFLNQRPGDEAVLNLDDSPTAEIAARLQARVRGFSRSDRDDAYCRVSEGRIVVGSGDRRQDICGVDEISLPGSHNLENVLAAVAAGALSGLPAASTAQACRSFSGVAHRLQYLGEAGGVAFYNDSKATNCDAALKALKAFDRDLVVIMGGLDKGGDFRSLREAVSARVRRLVLLGKAAAQLESDLGDLVPSNRVGTLAEAVEKAFEAARPDGVVLLAPACASFDMFDNFEQRGEVFSELVRQLQQQEQQK